jgi:capsular exopolysaccharide synthesis family protein
MQREASQSAATVEHPMTPTYAFARSLATIAQPNDGPAEAIRALRTHIMAQHVQGGRRALAVCAASLGVGCTYIASNLAVALAQIGVKVLLIDGNLRQPGVDAVIRPERATHGLQQCLASDDDNFSAFIEPDVLPNLSIMYAGGVPSNPQELLARDRFDALMNACLRDFELTIVDTPPANTCSDARRIATVLGYAMVIARRDESRIDDLKTLVGQLQSDHAKVVGTVLNEY